MSDITRITRYMVRRSDLVDGLLSVLERKVTASEKKLLEMTVTEFMDKLDLTEDGRVRNTLYNKRLLATIDEVFKKHGKTMGVDIAKTMIEGVEKVANFNGEYFRIFTTDAKLLPIEKEVQETIKAWLGLTERGALEANGYLDTLIKDTTVKNLIKDFSLRTVIGQQGWMESKRQLGEILTGNKEKEGAMKRYYRNYVYDTYSKVDRSTAEIFADKLKLNFAIYAGGLIKTSRSFCKARNGKVFHKSEILKFDPKVAKPPNYNPFTDLGGYGCRHHLNYIPDSVALILRPDAAKIINKSDKSNTEKINNLAEASAEEIEKIKRPYNTVYRDFEAKSIGSQKSEEELRKEFGRPIYTKYLFGKDNESRPSGLVQEMRDAGGEFETSKMFEDAKLTTVKIDDLSIVQEFVFETPLTNSTGTKAVWVARYKDVLYLLDGNHTAAKSYLMGKDIIDAKILDF